MPSCLRCRDHLHLPRTKAAGEMGDLMVTRVAGVGEETEAMAQAMVEMMANRQRRPRRHRSIRGAIRLHLPIHLVPWETCTGIAVGRDHRTAGISGRSRKPNLSHSQNFLRTLPRIRPGSTPHWTGWYPPRGGAVLLSVGSWRSRASLLHLNNWGSQGNTMVIPGSRWMTRSGPLFRSTSRATLGSIFSGNPRRND